MDFLYSHSTSPAHFSSALRHLRRSVTICAWLVGLALAAQVLTWATVNFTDARFERIESTTRGEVKPEIITHDRRAARPAASQAQKDSGVVHLIPPAGDSARPQPAATGENIRPDEVANAIQPPAAGQEPARADVNYQLSRYDVMLRTIENLALVIGSMSIVGLIVQLAVGVAVAAGAQTRGIGRVVSALNWSLALGAMLVPWHLISHEFAFRGLLSTYTDVCDISIRVSRALPGAMPGYLFYSQFLILPVAAVCAAALIGLKFSMGVESGILPSGPTPEELAIEAEASQRKASSLHGAGRTGGALRHTIGIVSAPNGSAQAYYGPTSNPNIGGGGVGGGNMTGSPQPRTNDMPTGAGMMPGTMQTSTGDPPLRRPI